MFWSMILHIYCKKNRSKLYTLFSRNAVALGNQGRYAIGWPPCRRPILVFHFRRTGRRFLPSDGCFLGLVVMDSDDVGEPSPKRSKHSNAGYFCAVPHCSNRSESGGSLHFHRFPANASRSKAWTHAIRRETGENFTVTSNTRVCSVHFRSADYRTVGRLSGDARQRVHLENDAVPSVFAWKPLSRATLEREARAEARKARETAAAERTVVKVTTDLVEVSVEAEIEVSSASPEEVRSRTPDEPVEVRSSPLAAPVQVSKVQPCQTPPPSLDHDYLVRRLHCAAGAADRIAQLEKENEMLLSDLKKMKSTAVTLEAVKGNNDKFKHITGLPNYGVFCALLQLFRKKSRAPCMVERAPNCP